MVIVMIIMLEKYIHVALCYDMLCDCCVYFEAEGIYIYISVYHITELSQIGIHTLTCLFTVAASYIKQYHKENP